MNRYIIFATNEKYYEVGYSEIKRMQNVHFQSDYLYKPGKIRKVLHSLHNFRGVAKLVDIPGKSIWYHQYFAEKHNPNYQYIFLFFHRWQKICCNGFVDYLRKKYPGCKCVLFLQDIDYARKIDMNLVKRTFDHVMLFEKNYAKQCGIEYYPLVYCEGLREIPLDGERPIDLLFVGGAKGRYDKLKKIYDRLESEGINCQFYLSRMDQEILEDEPGIHIVDTVEYEDNIRLLKKSKCVLDIIPSGTDCNTLRLSEAICYRNRVLTNNKNIVNEEFYRTDLISIYSNSDDIDVEFLKKPYTGVDYHYKDKISPEALLKHLENIFRN